MLLENNATTKAIIDLIPVLNITNLVMGTKRPPSSRYQLNLSALPFGPCYLLKSFHKLCGIKKSCHMLAGKQELQVLSTWLDQEC